VQPVLPRRHARRGSACGLVSLSGSDSDWVVKLIAVFPKEMATLPYRLILATAIRRSSSRTSFREARWLREGQTVHRSRAGSACVIELPIVPIKP
jgi:predicted acyl esterase